MRSRILDGQRPARRQRFDVSRLPLRPAPQLDPLPPRRDRELTTREGAAIVSLCVGAALVVAALAQAGGW